MSNDKNIRGWAKKLPQTDKDAEYDNEAKKLFAKLNLIPGNNRSRYNNLDAIWQDPNTSARVFIGNQTCASSRSILKKNGIKAVVNCTVDMPLYFESKEKSTDDETDNEKIDYFRFPIATWFSKILHNRGKNKGNSSQTPDKVILLFFKEVFDWIDARLAQSKNVLIHCLAGAHRAGTTGVVFVMRTAKLQLNEALALVKKIRPVVQPIGSLGTLAKMYDDAMNNELERKQNDPNTAKVADVTQENNDKDNESRKVMKKSAEFTHTSSPNQAKETNLKEQQNKIKPSSSTKK